MVVQSPVKNALLIEVEVDNLHTRQMTNWEESENERHGSDQKKVK